MQEIYCGNCGTPNPYGMKYCRKCGQALAYTQPPQAAAAHQPVVPPPAPASGMPTWLPGVLIGLIVTFGCLTLAVLGIYLFDPFGLFPGTPTPSATVVASATAPLLPSQTPIPSETPLPSATSEPATATAYPTYTSFPTYTEPAHTATLTPSATAEAFEFSNGAVDIPLVRYGGCAPSEVIFSVDVSSSENVTAIVLFTRLMDPASQNYITNWTSGVSMKDKGNNHYEINQSGNTLRQGGDPGTVSVVYQFVDQAKEGDYIHSKNHFDLTLEKCP